MPVLERRVPGAVGDIELLVQLPDDYCPGDPVAVVCHPHPLRGGTMNNKVVHTVARSFVEMGVPVARFNFRGVGESAGCYDEGRGESEDLLTVVNWLRRQYPQAPLWLAGFSFGAYVAKRTHLRAEAERLLLIAPPVTMYDFAEMPPLTVSSMVIQGSDDEVIDPQAVTAWVAEKAPNATYHWVEGAGHFFHGKLVLLRSLIAQSWGGDG